MGVVPPHNRKVTRIVGFFGISYGLRKLVTVCIVGAIACIACTGCGQFTASSSDQGTSDTVSAGTIPIGTTPPPSTAFGSVFFDYHSVGGGLIQGRFFLGQPEHMSGQSLRTLSEKCGIEVPSQGVVLPVEGSFTDSSNSTTASLDIQLTGGTGSTYEIDQNGDPICIDNLPAESELESLPPGGSMSTSYGVAALDNAAEIGNGTTAGGRASTLLIHYLPGSGLFPNLQYDGNTMKASTPWGPQVVRCSTTKAIFITTSRQLPTHANACISGVLEPVTSTEASP